MFVIIIQLTLIMNRAGLLAITANDSQGLDNIQLSTVVLSAE